LAVAGNTPSPVRQIVLAFSTHAIASARPLGPKPKLFRTSLPFTRIRATQTSPPGTLSYTPAIDAGLRGIGITPVSQPDQIGLKAPAISHGATGAGHGFGEL
jgi:hypothetical protein